MNRWFTYGVVTLATVGLAACSVGRTDDTGGSSTGNEPTAPATSTSAVPRGPLSTIPEGVFTVGEELKPGTYKVIAEADEGCYWVIYRQSMTNPVAGGNGPGYPKATLKKGQTFESHGCGAWKRIGP